MKNTRQPILIISTNEGPIAGYKAIYSGDEIKEAYQYWERMVESQNPDADPRELKKAKRRRDYLKSKLIKSSEERTLNMWREEVAFILAYWSKLFFQDGSDPYVRERVVHYSSILGQEQAKIILSNVVEEAREEDLFRYHSERDFEGPDFDNTMNR